MTVDAICILMVAVFSLGIAGGVYIRLQGDAPEFNFCTAAPDIYLSGAITGHEEEAKVYFAEAEAALYEKFPGCTVFNPMKLPKLPKWEDYMKICRPRVVRSTHIVFIINPQINKSRGVHEEMRIAKENGLVLYRYENKEIVAI